MARGFLGIADLYDAVMVRLDSVSFTITTRYDKHMMLLQFWLTVAFGATEIGLIATWYHRADLSAALAWAMGTALASGLLVTLLL